MDDVLDFINTTIREEKGSRIRIDSTLLDADLDSFGITVLFIELDDKYGYFSDLADDVDPFTTIAYETITIKEIINKCLSTATAT